VPKDAQPAILDLAKTRRGSVRRAVVDDDDLQPHADLPERARQGVRDKEVRSIARRDDDRDLGRLGLRHPAGR
jgi:hypothetical protein